MAKRKKNESIAEFRKRTSDAEIMDTSAPPVDLDTTSKDDDVNEDGIIETRLKNYRVNDMVFSMRMNQDLIERVKQAAREESVRLKKDVPYQLLISMAVEDKYGEGDK